MKAPTVLVAAALACASFAAAAQMAPGLWEHHFQSKSAAGGDMDKKMAEMQAKLASMPPDQRKMVEQAMASRGVTMGPQGTTVKACVTKEEAERKTVPQMGRPECTQEVVSHTASAIKVKWQCAGKEPSSGEGEMNFSGDKAYTGKSVMHVVHDGTPETMTSEMSGKWLGADCGDIKPRSATKP